MRSRLTERLHEGDETRPVFQRRQLNTRSNGRLNRAREPELEIRCVRRACIVAHRADDPKHQRTSFLGILAPPPRLTAPLGLVRAGLFLFTKKNATPVDVSSAGRDK
jgi:hypothetical protein